jgi:hypothetical protein
MTVTTIRRVLAVAAAGLAVLVSAALAPAPAGAAAQHDAMIRGGHFSPDTPGVDVYLTSFRGNTTTLWLSGVGYGDVSGYQRITPGLYAVSMRPHGAAASTPAALSWTLDARAGDAYTACAVGLNAKLHGIVLHDDLAAAPAGKARVRVIQAASRAPHATVSAIGGPTIADDVAFSDSTSYADVAAGTFTVRASAVGDASVRATARLSLAADSVHTIVVLDAPTKGITIRALDDATGATVAPVGAVPAGGGGTAHSSGTNPLAVGALIVGLLIAAAGGVSLGRQRRA